MNMFVINLDRTPERMLQFQQVNPHLPHVTRFQAVDGKTVDHKELLEQQIFVEPIFYKDASVGCMLSHRQLWNMAAEKGSNVTILEDDAIVHKDFMALAPAMLAELPSEWDIMFWGWNFDAEMSFDIFPGVPCLARFSQTDLRKRWGTIQNAAIRPTLHRLHYSFGLVGYSISPAGAKKITELAFPIHPFLHRLSRHNIEVENLSFDCHLTSLYDQLNAYVCFPPLVISQNDHASSTIQQDLQQRPFGRIRHMKRRLLGMTQLPPDESSFRLIPSTDYPNSREFTRKHAHYLYKKGDMFGATRKYLKHLFMRA